jgi:pyruvate ferredoxin oxidoreductase alpha subunit
MLQITEGSYAVAGAVKFCRPQVIAAYPITPQTHIVEALADFVANCELDAEYITVEN